MIRLLTENDKTIIFEYLARNEIETSFLYSNIIECGIDNNRDNKRCGDYFGFFRDGSLAGIIPFYNLGSCLPHFEAEEAIPHFAQLIKERSFDEYLLGMKRVVGPVYEGIKAFKETLEFNESSYMANKSLKPYIIDGLEFIDPGERANDEVIKFLIHVRNKGFHENTNAEEVRKSLSFSSPEEDRIIAVKDGKFVSYAKTQAYTNTIGQIGSVYTDEEERGKGYGKAVVSEICRRIIERNRIPTLIVKKNNIPAVKAYTSLGFENFDDYLLIKLK